MTTALNRFIAGLAASVCLHADEAGVPVGVGLQLVTGRANGHRAAHVLDWGHPVVTEDRADAAGVRADVGTEGLGGGAPRGQTERAGKHQDSQKRLHVWMMGGSGGRCQDGSSLAPTCVFSAPSWLIREPVLREKTAVALTGPDRPSTL